MSTATVSSRTNQHHSPHYIKVVININCMDEATSKTILPGCVTWDHTCVVRRGGLFNLKRRLMHYSNVTVGVVASQISGVSNVCSSVSSGTDRRKHQSSASLAFVRGIHRSPVNSPHKCGQWRGKCFHLMTSSWFWRGMQHQYLTSELIWYRL